MIFGSTRDTSLLLHMRRELVHEIVSQEILYYKLDEVSTQVDIYGEAPEKSYYVPVKLNCRITRGDQDWKNKDFGPDLERSTQFAFIKEDFIDAQFKPDLGDIICWQENYFEVDAIKENQLFFGKDEEYRLNPEELHKFGESVSVVLSTHLTRYTKLNLVNSN